MANVSKRPKLIRRKGRKPWHFYYYQGGKRHLVSTGETVLYLAEEYLDKFLAEQDRQRSSCTFWEWADPFFIRGKCPHERRLKDEKKTISVHWQECQRAWLLNYILKNPKLPGLYLHEISRGDIITFRSWLVDFAAGKETTIDKVMQTLKVIFREAYIREVIDRNPCDGVGKIQYTPKETPIFTPGELYTLFFENPPWPWRDLLDYTCFFLACTLGCRRGEILALQWKHVDFERHIITIEQAWKKKEGIGRTKTGVVIDKYLPGITLICFGKSAIFFK